MLAACYRGLSDEELVRVETWEDSLRQQEKLRVEDISDGLYTSRATRTWGAALIVAGSSLIKPDYPDIDLFLIPQRFYVGSNFEKEGDVLREELLEFGCWLNFNWRDEYGNAIADNMYKGTHHLEQGDGKPITCFLLYEKKGLQHQREGKKDIIYRPHLSAEELIELNRGQDIREHKGINADMEVLFRRYIGQRE